MYHQLEVFPSQQQIQNGQFFPQYEEVVQAPTADAAIKMVERRNPGCIVQHRADWMPSENNREMQRNNNSGDIDADTLKLTAGLVLVGGAAFVTWVCLPEILAIGGIVGAVKVANKNHEKFTKGLTGTKKNVRRLGVTFLAAMTLMGVGYGVGTGIHNAFDYDRSDNTEQVQTIQQN